MTSDSSQELKQAPWSKQDAEREKDSDSNPVGSIPVVVAKFEFRGNFATDSRLKRDGYRVPSSGRRGISTPARLGPIATRRMMTTIKQESPANRYAKKSFHRFVRY